MKIMPIEDGNSNFDKVIIKSDTDDTQPSPHCKEHGAMNKVSVFDRGGYWRCCTAEGITCRAGCMQIN